MVDKVCLSTRDFYVKDSRAVSPNFKVLSAETDLTTGEQNNHFLFTDKLGSQVYGRKAYFNHEADLYQLTIDGRGLLLQFNPSKPYHPYELVPDEKVLKERCERVVTDLAKRGVVLDPATLSMVRLDLTRNREMVNPISTYGTAFNFMRMKRTTRQASYPDGFSAGNKSWGVLFYDKLEDVRVNQKRDVTSNLNLMRGENQLKKSDTIRATTGLHSLSDLYQAGMTHLDGVYKNLMKDRVFRLKQEARNGEQLVINFDEEVRYLTALRSKSERKAIDEYLIDLGLPLLLDTYGSLDTFANVLEQAGFSRVTVWRRIDKLNRQIQRRAFARSEGPLSVTAMYKELTLKFAS